MRIGYTEKYNRKSLGSVQRYFFPLFDKGGDIEIEPQDEKPARIALQTYIEKEGIVINSINLIIK